MTNPIDNSNMIQKMIDVIAAAGKFSDRAMSMNCMRSALKCIEIGVKGVKIAFYSFV